MLDLSAPFLNSAQRSSRRLGKTPDINITNIKNSDLNSLQTSLKVWLENLRQYSNKTGAKYNKPILVLRGVIKGIPYVGPAIDALILCIMYLCPQSVVANSRQSSCVSSESEICRLFPFHLISKLSIRKR